MRNSLVLIGVLLIAGGGYVLLEGGAITTREDVISVGSLQVSAETKQPILPWMAWIGIVAGGAMVVSGLTRKS